MEKKGLVKEIFPSIQGEGRYIGFKQLFIRFSGCNLTCEYCDTEHLDDVTCYTPCELLKATESFNLENFHSISLTGGEPLLQQEFLQKFLPLVSNKIYLETNGTLFNEFENIARFIDYAAIDIKLPSTTGQKELFDVHEKFIKTANANKIEAFVKIVFDDTITDFEISKSADICKKYSIPLILQPKMHKDKMLLCSDSLIEIMDKFLTHYDNVRLIAQMHKFLYIE